MRKLNSRKYGFTLFEDELEEILNTASSLGVNHIEINFPQRLSPNDAFDNNRAKNIIKLAESANIKLSFHLPYSVSISDIIPGIRKAGINFLKKSIEAAGKINAAHITIHMGTFYWFPAAKWMRKKALDRFIKNIIPILEICEAHNVIIALENVAPIPHGSDYYYLGDNVHDFKYIFDNINSEYLAFCFDAGHANLGEGVRTYIDELGHKIVTVHFHDNDSTNDDHRAVGDGTINWNDVIKGLIKINYTGPLITECRDKIKYESIQILEKKFLDYLDKNE
ncbi:sugar phosphate isomerase/epimerase family protein [Bacteroidota bacterium]